MSGVDLAIFLATSGHSGVDRVFRNLVPALANHGLRIDLLGIEGHGPEYVDLPENVRHYRFKVRHVYSALPSLVSYLKSAKPAVLLSDKDKVNRTLLLASRLAGVDSRVVFRLGTTVSVNLASRGWLERKVQTLSMRWLYRFADRIVVPSRGAAEDLIALAALDPARVQVVPNPVVRDDMATLAAMRPDMAWFEDGGPPVILGVGELSARKDFATLVRAHARLVKKHVDCRLVILGEGGRRAALLKLAEELGTADCVSLPGFVANPYPYMANAAAFALTSRWEGLGIVLVEALALGTPSVACDCPSGPREVLVDGHYGPLVPVGDAAGLAEALEALLRHPPAPEFLRQAARPYTVQASAESYLQALGLPAANEKTTKSQTKA